MTSLSTTIFTFLSQILYNLFLNFFAQKKPVNADVRMIMHVCYETKNVEPQNFFQTWVAPRKKRGKARWSQSSCSYKNDLDKTTEDTCSSQPLTGFREFLSVNKSEGLWRELDSFITKTTQLSQTENSFMTIMLHWFPLNSNVFFPSKMQKNNIRVLF